MPITTYTLADLRTRLQDRVEGVPYWTTADLDDALNEALLTWNFYTGYWRTTITLVTAPNTFDYGLPASLVFGARVRHNGLPLTVSSLWEMDQGRGGWRNETTASGGDVPGRVIMWIPVSLLFLHLWPAPAAAGTLTVEGVARTPTLVNASDPVDLADELLATLLDGAVHCLAYREGGDRFQATLPLWQAFLQGALEENGQLIESAAFRHSLGVDRGRDLRPTKRPAPVTAGGEA